MLKAIYDKLEEIPEALREFYTERNGRFEIKVEGMKTQADIDRVQSALTNEKTAHTATKAAAKINTDALASLKDVIGEKSADEIQSALHELETLKAAGGGTPDPHKIDDIVNRRVEAALKTKTAPLERKVADLTGQLAEKDKAITDLTGSINTRKVDDEIRTAALAAKVSPAVLDDILVIARGNFELSEDGKVVTKDGLDAKTWVSDQKQARGYWWTPAAGAGAQGQGGNLPNGQANPFAHGTWNMTEQGKLVTTDRAAAERMAVAAGTTIGGGKPPAPAAKVA